MFKIVYLSQDDRDILEDILNQYLDGLEDTLKCAFEDNSFAPEHGDSAVECAIEGLQELHELTRDFEVVMWLVKKIRRKIVGREPEPQSRHRV